MRGIFERRLKSSSGLPTSLCPNSGDFDWFSRPSLTNTRCDVFLPEGMRLLAQLRHHSCGLVVAENLKIQNLDTLTGQFFLFDVPYLFGKRIQDLLRTRCSPPIIRIPLNSLSRTVGTNAKEDTVLSFFRTLKWPSAQARKLTSRWSQC